MRKINLPNNTDNNILKSNIKSSENLNIKFNGNVQKKVNDIVIEKIDLDFCTDISDNIDEKQMQQVILNRVDANLEKSNILSEELNNDIFNELEEELNIINERINGNG